MLNGQNINFPLEIKIGDQNQLINNGELIYSFKQPFQKTCLGVLITDIIGHIGNADYSSISWRSDNFIGYNKDKFALSTNLESFLFLAIGY